MASQLQPAGSICSLSRYPVKSMLGEELEAVRIEAQGMQGDRCYAVQDVLSGEVTSAKQPHRWRELLRCQATTEPGCWQSARSSCGVDIRLPSGLTFRSRDPVIAEVLSEQMGRDVRLISQPFAGAEIERSDPDEVLRFGTDAQVHAHKVRLGRAVPAASFFDYASIHILTTSSVAFLAEATGVGVEVQRFRPNILIRTDAQPFSENHWVDRMMSLGAEVRVQILCATPRCSVPTLVHGELPQRPEILRAVARLNRTAVKGVGSLPCLGVYARVISAGTVRVGDIATLL